MHTATTCASLMHEAFTGEQATVVALKRELEIARAAREAETTRAAAAEAARVAALAYARVIPRTAASIHADRVHAMACALVAGDTDGSLSSEKLAHFARRAVEVVDAELGEADS